MLGAMKRPHARVVGGLRRLLARPRLLPITALLLRARTVRPSLAFVLRESTRRRGVGLYRLRESGLRVVIRHGTGDVVTLGELFHEHDYRPTAEVQPALREVGRVVDLGANIGLFGAYAAARWPDAEILAFEPDPDNAAIHARAIALNSLGRRWRLVQAAAGTSAGRTRFLGGGIALSRVADTDEAHEGIDVPVEDVMPRLAEADLVKMDIEGGEWKILADPRFREFPPRAIVLEYHPRFCASGDPRAAAEDALTAAGFQVHSIWHRADGHGMLWAWQT